MSYRAITFLCAASFALIGAKPPSGTVNPQVAYTVLAGNGTELRVTNEDGTNSATLYKSATAINIDTAPRAQHQIGFTEGGALKLLTYGVSGSGAFQTTSVATLYDAGAGGANRVDFLDFSPDGSKIAFSAGGGTRLMVYDLATNSASTWTTDIWVGDMTWHAGAIAYIGAIDPQDPSQHVFEVAGPGAPRVDLLSERELDLLDSSRTDPDALVVTYNRTGSSGPLVGLWKAGSYVDDNLGHGTFTDWGTLNCDDTKLMYATPDRNGQAIWYIRNLSNGLNSLYTKTVRVRHTQFWPTC
jgi:hypothetical protein